MSTPYSAYLNRRKVKIQVSTRRLKHLVYWAKERDGILLSGSAKSVESVLWGTLIKVFTQWVTIWPSSTPTQQTCWSQVTQHYYLSWLHWRRGRGERTEESNTGDEWSGLQGLKKIMGWERRRRRDRGGREERGAPVLCLTPFSFAC